MADTTTQPQTLAELSAALAERSLSMTVYPLGDDWIVWLFANDDPALGVFPGEGPDLPTAVAAAIAAWDGSEIQEDEGDDEGEASN